MWLTNNLQVSLTHLKATPKIIKYGFMDSKFGQLLLGLTTIAKGAKSCNAICVLYFIQENEIATLKEVQQRWPNVEFMEDAESIDQVIEILSIDKENTAAIDVAVVGTDLQFAVWNELIKLKAGKTLTYSELAELVQRPKAVRAVANAVAKNEVSILIPCHRIVSKSGAVKYHWGAKLKSDLLAYEAK
ncbi:bifunctional transcriptional activator/DNA repair enzyme Ada [Drosophila nasuta]|uniref:bifunctional transcriptional activator/DNA repair enzyme Ada n=1 Tax=Drosophila nasuta TaxID=42062 RepID=UPI00295EA490|nr:bifunctional transcriptional activator/DNA repair enzyme Ada [Drosophila nasuta]